MKWFYFLLLSFTLIFSDQSFADHILGGTLGYKFISSDGDKSTYRVKLELYYDCSIVSLEYGALFSHPEIYIFKGSQTISHPRLIIVDSLSAVDIAPLCEDEKQNSVCLNPSSEILGSKRFVYVNDVTLNGKDSNWSFVFYGLLNGSQVAHESGRFAQNANIFNYATDPAAADILYLKATLNNMDGPNSSPEFTSWPVPFFCKNNLSYYTLGAADIDNDILQFKLVPGKAVNSESIDRSKETSYRNPFTGAFPVPADPDYFNFNESNGQLIFTPRSDTSCLVREEVSEYRNGVLVGRTARQVDFIIMGYCDAAPPLSPISNITNASYSVDASGNIFLSACEGLTDTVSFDISSTDPNNDNVFVDAQNVPAVASVNVEQNGTSNPKAHFEWNLTDAYPATYYFYITYTDDGCPYQTRKTVGYTMTVIPHNIKFASGSSGSCATTSDGKGWVVPIGETSIDYSYKWVDANGNILRNVHSLVGDTIKNVPPGTYKVYVRNSDGCGKNIFVTVDTTKPPVVLLQNDSTICEGMPIQIGAAFEDGVDYKWNTGQDTCCIIAMQTGSYVLNATNHCGFATDNVTLDFVKCNYCLFIPNAFTPNGDGDNDVFQIIPTCLFRTFKIQIFNRYGQLVYVSYSLNNMWDGTFKGRPIDIGTFHYVIKADYEDVSRGTLQLKGDVTVLK